MRRRAREWRMLPSQTNAAMLLPARLLATAEGYAMCIRRQGFPFVVLEHVWDSADLQRGATDERERAQIASESETEHA
jgi:hypothetical protein